MKNWTKTLIKPTQSIREAMELINHNRLQIALIVDDNQRLVGTLTDGDIRRGILKGMSLQESVVKIMFQKPTVAKSDQSRESVLAIMKEKDLNQIPIVDSEGRLTGLTILMDFFNKQSKENVVVLMAGGLGSRLGSMTKNCPKPLLKVGNKPLLETIIENFIQHGFEKFYISINYMADKIKAYFGDGSNWNADIRYIEEKKRMGTAGALSLLKEIPKEAFIVMNGDVLTKVNFQHLVDFHNDNNSVGTMCVREYDFQVPYGVIRTDGVKISSIDEKPVHRFYVNAGIYIFEPSIFKYIPKDCFFDMPQLFEALLKDEKETSVFPLNEYWIDIGQVDDFYKADGDYNEFFAS